MGTKKSKLDEIGKGNSFKVPEGYFEQFTNEMMSRLPERTLEEYKTPGLWERMKPWAYMAAMFVGIALMINVFVKSPSKTSSYKNQAESGIAVKSSTDIDDFYTYYEDQAASNVYRETLFLEIPPSESFDY